MRSYYPASALVALLMVCSANAGILFANPGLVLPQTLAAPGIIPASQQQSAPLAHQAVVENAIAESQLPQELLNPFYKNPAIAAGLAKESWFTNKEFPIHHREAEKIPRSEIYKIVSRLQSVKRR